MKTYHATFSASIALAIPLLLGGFQPGHGADTPPRRPVVINPATGLPSTSGPMKIDPVTGLPVPAPRSRPVKPVQTSPVDIPPRSTLDQGRHLMNKGRFEDALQCYQAYVAETRKSVTNGPLSAALPDWVELGQRYPKAKQTLIDLRDSTTREFMEGRGSPNLFQELVKLDTALEEEDHAFALFLGLRQADPFLAGSCYDSLQPLLVQRGEYQLCGEYLPHPKTRFNVAKQCFETVQSHARYSGALRQQNDQHFRDMAQKKGYPAPAPQVVDLSAMEEKSATDHFVRLVSQYIEILVGCGRTSEAEEMRLQAIATVRDPQLMVSIDYVRQKAEAKKASLRPRPAPMAVTSVFPERPNLFPAERPIASASEERWSPAIAPGVNPDVQAILTEAQTLGAGPQFEPALQRHIWYHNHALEYEPEKQRGIRLTSALSSWIELGRKYPRARDALLEILDRDLYEFSQGRGSPKLFKDVAAINEKCGYYRNTCRLFEYLDKAQPELAKSCYPAAEASLAKERQYALCVAYIGDGQGRFNEHRIAWEKLSGQEEHIGRVLQRGYERMGAHAAQNGTPPPSSLFSGPPRAANNILVRNIRVLIEILVGAEQSSDAEAIRQQALALVNDPQIESAVADAEQRIAMN